MYYKTKEHKKIFEEQIKSNPCKCPNDYLAVIYLLTSNRKLWDYTQAAIRRKNIDFSIIHTPSLDPNRYMVLSVAKDLYSGTTHITIKDICDIDLVSDKIFNLILTALSIYRLGYEYIEIPKVFN